jgi:glycerol-3-phosphate dehydrogenase
MAEVAWAIRYEMARTIDDVLARRVRLLFLDARAAIASVRKLRLLAKELDHDEAWTQNHSRV